jgi:tRNA-splicing ligase RtcB (3'-phosphate/5'-hydroxy nucleic acid ligase)
MRKGSSLIGSTRQRSVAEAAAGAYQGVVAVAHAAEAGRLARKVARAAPLVCIQG